MDTRILRTFHDQLVLIAIPHRSDQGAQVIHAFGKGVEPAVTRHDQLGEMLVQCPTRTNGNRPVGTRPKKPGLYIWTGTVEAEPRAAGALRTWTGEIRPINQAELAAMFNGSGDPWVSNRMLSDPNLLWG